MAHFAELDANNVVLRVIVVGNSDTADASGVEKEYIGAAFCERLLGGTWKQTSYNANIRKTLRWYWLHLRRWPGCVYYATAVPVVGAGR
jgi:hypothetical protein